MSKNHNNLQLSIHVPALLCLLLLAACSSEAKREYGRKDAEREAAALVFFAKELGTAYASGQGPTDMRDVDPRSFNHDPRNVTWKHIRPENISWKYKEDGESVSIVFEVPTKRYKSVSLGILKFSIDVKPDGTNSVPEYSWVGNAE